MKKWVYIEHSLFRIFNSALQLYGWYNRSAFKWTFIPQKTHIKILTNLISDQTLGVWIITWFSQIDDLTWFFKSTNTFCKLLLKSWQKRWNRVACTKSCNFWPNRWFFVVFHEIMHLLQPFAQTLTKTPKRGSLHEKLQVLAKSTIFHVFSRNQAPLATFGWKVRRNAETRCFLRKLASFGQIDDFSCFFAKWGTFCDFWRKSSSKRRKTVVSSKSWKFRPNRRFFVFFRETTHFLRFLPEKFVKTPKHGAFFENFQV